MSRFTKFLIFSWLRNERICKITGHKPYVISCDIPDTTITHAKSCSRCGRIEEFLK